jgi:hypothetical protein
LKRGLTAPCFDLSAADEFEPRQACVNAFRFDMLDAVSVSDTMAAINSGMLPTVPVELSLLPFSTKLDENQEQPQE